MYCYGHDGFRSMQGRFYTTRDLYSFSDWLSSMDHVAILLGKSALQSVTIESKSHKLCDIDRPLIKNTNYIYYKPLVNRGSVHFPSE